MTGYPLGRRTRRQASRLADHPQDAWASRANSFRPIARASDSWPCFTTLSMDARGPENGCTAKQSTQPCGRLAELVGSAGGVSHVFTVNGGTVFYVVKNMGRKIPLRNPAFTGVSCRLCPLNPRPFPHPLIREDKFFYETVAISYTYSRLASTISASRVRRSPIPRGVARRACPLNKALHRCPCRPPRLVRTGFQAANT